MRKNSGTSRPAVRVATAAALGCATAALALSGCSLEYREDVCSHGEYPVTSIGGTGSACVSDDERPPAGYTRYPEGKVPRHVDDKWDVYWRTHMTDESGAVVDAPEAG
ncbi:SCO0607 family lipoprotein [Streptomyces sp. NPDC048219]|uniref:SCO0607 family lipoprotein n=1 Tax=Streptomyces sp. NPDC048219 TaxID=3365517 RepID=UPI0037224259